MKKFRILISILLFSISIFSFKKVLMKSYNENLISKNYEYLFRWWDLVEIKKDDKTCSSHLFENINLLKISCKDYQIANWLQNQKGERNIDILSVVPAQALFYKLKDFQSARLKYLTITWNDFSNREKSVLAINKIFNSINKKCIGNKRVVFVLIPTSNQTINGSKTNFKDKNVSIFSQAFIEDKLINYKDKCIKRSILRDEDQNIPIAYWIEFKTFWDNDKI